MPSSLRYLIVASLFVLTSACTTTNQGSVGLRASTALEPEANTTWSRPMEVGYDFTGEEIEGTASATSLFFGLISFGAQDSSLLSGIITTVTGRKEDDGLTRAAAYDAMEKTANVDGIYITRQAGNSFDFLGIYRKQDMTVRGKALRLRVVGEVSQERADRERYLKALPEGSVDGAAAGTATTPSIIEQILGK